MYKPSIIRARIACCLSLYNRSRVASFEGDEQKREGQTGEGMMVQEEEEGERELSARGGGGRRRGTGIGIGGAEEGYGGESVSFVVIGTHSLL